MPRVVKKQRYSDGSMLVIYSDNTRELILPSIPIGGRIPRDARGVERNRTVRSADQPTMRLPLSDETRRAASQQRQDIEERGQILTLLNAFPRLPNPSTEERLLNRFIHNDDRSTQPDDRATTRLSNGVPLSQQVRLGESSQPDASAQQSSGSGHSGRLGGIPRPGRPNAPGQDTRTFVWGQSTADIEVSRSRMGQGVFGEQGMGWAEYSLERGWAFAEGPSGGPNASNTLPSGAHAWNQPGFDGVAFRLEGPFELHILDNKTFSSSRNIGGASAIMRNLRNNLNDLRTRVNNPNYNSMPRIVDVRSALLGTIATLDAGLPIPNNVRLVITNFGGASNNITERLQKQGIIFRDLMRVSNQGTSTTSSSSTSSTTTSSTPSSGGGLTGSTFSANSSVSSRQLAEVLSTLGSKINRIRRYTSIIRRAANIFSAIMDILGQIGDWADVLDMWGDGTLFDEQQRFSERLEANARQLLRDVGQLYQDLTRAIFQAQQSIYRSETQRDAESLAAIANQTATLATELDGPLGSANYRGGRLVERGQVTIDVGEVFLEKVRTVNLSMSEAAQHLMIGISLQELGGTIRAAGRYYLEAAELMSQLQNMADTLQESANSAIDRAFGSDTIRLIQALERIEQEDRIRRLFEGPGR